MAYFMAINMIPSLFAKYTIMFPCTSFLVLCPSFFLFFVIKVLQKDFNKFIYISLLATKKTGRIKESVGVCVVRMQQDGIGNNKI